MSPANTAILAAFKYGPQTIHELARVTGLAPASVRRSIQELRRLGYNISFSDHTGGPYVLGGTTR